MGRQILSRLPLFQASSLLWPGSAVEDGPSPWALHPMGDQEKHLAPAFRSVQCAGHGGHWRVNQRQRKTFLCLSFSLTVHSASPLIFPTVPAPSCVFFVVFVFVFLTSRVDSERERDREKGLPLPLVHPPMATAAGTLRPARCGRRMALIPRQEPGASLGLPWGAGPKELGHLLLLSQATAESYIGSGI